jgi:hypothetical protein
VLPLHGVRKPRIALRGRPDGSGHARADDVKIGGHVESKIDAGLIEEFARESQVLSRSSPG